MDYLISDWSTQNNRALSHAQRDGGRCGLIRGIILLWVSLLEEMMQSTWNINHKTQTPFCTNWPFGTVFMNAINSLKQWGDMLHSSKTIWTIFPFLVKLLYRQFFLFLYKQLYIEILYGILVELQMQSFLLDKDWLWQEIINWSPQTGVKWKSAENHFYLF